MTPKLKNWYAEIAVAILVIALIILSVFLVRQYWVTAHQTQVSFERARFASLREKHSLTAADIMLIAPWMTFDYVSVSFKVPSSYLAASLGIPSMTAGYPNITIARYARSIATSSAAFTSEVQAVVKTYLVPTSASTSPAIPVNAAPSNQSASTVPQEE